MASVLNTILFNKAGGPRGPDEVRRRIDDFPYKDASERVILDSVDLDPNGTVFLQCTARVLSNFGMTRSGRFKGVRITKNGTVHHKDILVDCWETVGSDLLDIRSHIPKNGRTRDRYLLELSEPELAR